MERLSRPEIPKLPYDQRVVICDGSGELHSLLVHESDTIEFVATQTLDQAVEAVRECPAHAVVINTALPQDCPSLVEEARSRIPDTPVIGCGFPPQLSQARAYGVVDYLIKPITHTELEAAIAAIGRTVRRILVVDDEPDVRQLLTRMLHAYDPALEVICVSNGEGALHELNNNPPDLMLLDIMMPGTDGWKVLQRRKESEIDDIPVLIISAQDPFTQPMRTETIVATIGAGLSVSRLLRCTLELSSILLSSDTAPVQAPE